MNRKPLPQELKILKYYELERHKPGMFQSWIPALLFMIGTGTAFFITIFWVLPLFF